MELSAKDTPIYSWSNSIFKPKNIKFSAITGDASLRKYYRVSLNNNSYIAMDSSNDLSLERFIEIAAKLEACKVKVPKIIAKDLTKRFLLLEDLGDNLYLDKLNNFTCDKLYIDALGALVKIQTNLNVKECNLPTFSYEFIKTQINTFKKWYLETNLKVLLDKSDLQFLDELALWLAKFFSKLPQCFVHLDYHSRNLLVLNKNNPGILDFQDAMLGPSVYDLVSLFQDAYIYWEETKIISWLMAYNDLLSNANSMLRFPSDFELIKAFDIVGLQRHLKNLGVFSRLYYRDNKKEYLNNIPQLISYIFTTCDKYDEPIIKETSALLKKFVDSIDIHQSVL